METGPADASPTPDDIAPLLASPRTVRALRRTMWGFLFFLPLLSVYLDVIGWLVLLASARGQDGSWPGRRRLRTTAWCGLVVAGARVGAVAVGILPTGTILLVPSLLLAAAFLWQLCDLIIRMAGHLRDRTVAAQARTRRLLYVVQALMPLLALGANAIRSQAGSLAAMVAYLLAGVAITTLVLAFLANAASMCRAAMATVAGKGQAAS